MTEQEKYRQILLRHRKVIWAVCFNYALGKKELAADLVQEVSIALFLEMDKLRPGSTVLQERMWVRWQSRAIIKKVMPKLRNNFSELDEEKVMPLALSQYADKELIEEIMSHLTDAERKLLQLEFDGYKGDEVAKKLGIEVNTFYQRRHRIIEKLIKIYNNE